MKRLTKDKAELLALQFRATIGASMAYLTIRFGAWRKCKYGLLPFS